MNLVDTVLVGAVFLVFLVSLFNPGGYLVAGALAAVLILVRVGVPWFRDYQTAVHQGRAASARKAQQSRDDDRSGR